MIRIAIELIRQRAAQRPPGYFEDVLSRGVVIGGDLELSPAAYCELVAKYDPRRFPVLPRPVRRR